jgi:hypothetical protein
MLTTVVWCNDGALYRYISCFRHPARAAGEGAYYLVHFVSAVSFIENLDASLLSMDPADFDLCVFPALSFPSSCSS